MVFYMIKQTQNLVQALKARRALKVIAGIDNFDLPRVVQIAKAAERSGANAVDISSSEDIVRAVLEACSDIAVTVSSMQVSELLRAAELGAHMLELGNYEALYAQGIYPSASEIRELTRTLITGLDGLSSPRPLVSVTVAGHLDMLEQIRLCEWLDAAGVDVIQTEGSALIDSPNTGLLGQLDKLKLSLASTLEFSKVISPETYILTASGISPDTAALAIAAGAHGVGVGKYINKLETEIEMLAAISALRLSLEGRFEQVEAACL